MVTTGPERKAGRQRVLTALQAGLGLVFVASGAAKLVGAEGQVQNFERWGYPQWFRVTTGGTETLAGLGLLAGVFYRPLGALGGSLAAGTMLGAVYTHLLRADDPASAAAAPGTLLAIAAVVTGRSVRRPKRARSAEGGTEPARAGGRTDDRDHGD